MGTTKLLLADSSFVLVRTLICYLETAVQQLPLCDRSVEQYDADGGSNRIGEDVRGAGVSRRKKRLEHLNREADRPAEHDGDDAGPLVFAYHREVGAKTHAERNEPGNVLEDVLPI